MQLVREYLTGSNVIVAGLIGAALFVACNEEGQIDLCDDDLDCNDGLICEITGEDDGVCVEDLDDA